MLLIRNRLLLVIEKCLVLLLAQKDMLVNSVQKRENAKIDFRVSKLSDLNIKNDLMHPNPNSLPTGYFLSLPIYFIR
jgi:hypothetical protein